MSGTVGGEKKDNMEQMILRGIAMVAGTGRPVGPRRAMRRNKTAKRSTWRVSSAVKNEEGA